MCGPVQGCGAASSSIVQQAGVSASSTAVEQQAGDAVQQAVVDSQAGQGAAQITTPAQNVSVPAGTSTPAEIDSAYRKLLDAEDPILRSLGRPAGRDGAERGALTPAEHLAVAQQLGVVREITAMGLFGEPGSQPGADYSGYTKVVGDGQTMRLWVNGQKVAEEPAGANGDTVAFAAKYGVQI